MSKIFRNYQDIYSEIVQTSWVIVPKLSDLYWYYNKNWKCMLWTSIRIAQGIGWLSSPNGRLFTHQAHEQTSNANGDVCSGSRPLEIIKRLDFRATVHYIMELNLWEYTIATRIETCQFCECTVVEKSQNIQIHTNSSRHPCRKDSEITRTYIPKLSKHR